MLRNSSGSVGTTLLRNLTARCIWRCFPLAGCGRACSRSRAGSRCNRELARVGVTLELLRQEYLDGAVGPAKRRLAMTGSTAIMATSPAALSGVGRKPAAASAGRLGGHRCRCLYSCLAGLAHAGCPVLPYSRCALVEATLNMRQESWLRAHAAIFAFFGGTVPRIIPDNSNRGNLSFARGRSRPRRVSREAGLTMGAGVMALKLDSVPWLPGTRVPHP